MTVPWWLHRQTDPHSAAFVPGSPHDNVAARDWTVIGTLASLERATVDPRGMVTPREGSWSLDWQVRADRWHAPSESDDVVQRLVDGTPVVETVLTIPDGEILHRAFAVRSSDGASHVVVEVENRSAAAVAVAFVVRPWSVLGAAPVQRVDVEGANVRVDGVPGVLLTRAPAAVHLSAAGDALAEPETDARSATSTTGQAEAALVVPLPHRIVVRAVLPLLPPDARRGRGRRPAPAVTVPDPLPTADQVSKGWKVQGARATRLVVPDRPLERLTDVQRRHVLLVAAREDLTRIPAAPFHWVDAATQLEALDAYGYHDEADQVLATFEERQALDGQLLGDDRRLDANGAALHALATHVRVTGDDELALTLVGPVAKAAQWVDRRRTGTRSRRAGPSLAERWWSWRGLLDAADLLLLADQPAAAAVAARSAEEAAAALGDDASPDSVLDAVLLSGLDPHAGVVDVTLEALRAASVVDRGVFVAGAGSSARLTARLGRVELARAEQSAIQRLVWLLDHATPTGTWPELAHPVTGAGCGGAGHDGVATAEVLLFVRDLLVRPTATGLALCPVIPAAWVGKGWEAHDVPTAFGRFGYAVRWHDDRPAVLWELDPHPGVTELSLRAPGLDPAWSSTAIRGEALFPPMAKPTAEQLAAERAAVVAAPAGEGVVTALPSPGVRRRGAPS